MRAMTEYDWPGNVRELSNLVERAMILAEGDRIETEHLPEELTEGEEETSLALDEVVRECEKNHIRNILELTEGKRSEAADILDIDPATLYRRLSKYDISD
jgi:DNA-binding NtrC family response regulator